MSEKVSTVSTNITSSDKPAIIPIPKTIKNLDGNFTLTDDIIIIANNSELDSLCKVLQEKISSDLRISLKTGDVVKPTKKHIKLCLDDSQGGNSEAGKYSLTISENEVEVSGETAKGVFYGIQTLRQIVNQYSNKPIPCMMIKDEAHFHWRGFMLDCCRHFMPISVIKKYIDILAFYKFNKLHLHLTEDQGWRVEIKKYPLLTEKGAYRGPEKYGGFYTQKELKEISDYAGERFIEIIPEIELPGHCTAALAAYPKLGCTEEAFEVSGTFHKIHEQAFCAGKAFSYEFLKDVFDEVIDLLKPRYIHIGGDECLKNRWSECPSCRNLMEKERLQSEEELQAYFIRQISDYIIGKGCSVIGWEEVLQGKGIHPDMIVQIWQGKYEKMEQALKAGHDVIMSPTTNCYLNYSYDRIDFEQAFNFEPYSSNITEAQKEKILGGEACVWTEDITFDSIDTQVFPRLSGVIQSLWSGENDNEFSEFETIFKKHYEILNRTSLRYSCAH